MTQHLCRWLLLLSFIIASTYAEGAPTQITNPTIQPQIVHKLDPLLVIVLMVKNETNVICPTLQAFVDAGIQSYLIYDTGSTDNTVPCVQEFFKKHHVQDGIVYQEFTDSATFDFAKSRNRALQLAQERFPKATFMLMPDAEWYFNNVPGLLKFCQDHKQDTSPGYLVNISNGVTDNYQPRLIRCHSQLSFVGARHEYINRVLSEKVPKDSFFKWQPGNVGIEKSHNRWLSDLNIFLKEYEKNPYDPRTIFYIAQTYACLGQWENACIWYEKRVNFPLEYTWYEETFVARYRLAQAYEVLEKWDLALHHYLSAFSFRSHRAEPLVRLAQHYWNTSEFALCYLFAKRATELAFPEGDILFIDKELYDFTRYDLLGRAAWYVGEYAIGEDAVRRALTVHPDIPYLHFNLSLFETRKNAK